ncbi:serine/threonine-protein kinase [Schaalia sp. ZJ1691]|uniref:serine/threonine protein kinase n=1 Tax=Schaalia sp. ZJ1691 TaxID=2709404 RepID=UPI0013EA34BE|nr:serine/threonine-protein kinase [Schaalia sp. ZJ1691]
MESGDEIGGYRLLERLGAGGAGTVWLAEDGGGSPVAFKLIHPALAASEEARARLVREARTVNSVKDRGVAPVLDVETDASLPFVVSEYIEGPTLSALIAQGPLPGAGVVHLAAHLARTIEAVHHAGVIHRDIKPSNIICSPYGPVLIDFGIAMRDEDERLTMTGLVSGTAGYTAPEILQSRPSDEASDWWAWCATVLASATGRPPFGGGDLQAVMMRVLNDDPDVAGLPVDVASLLRDGMSADRNRRPSPGLIVAHLAAAVGMAPSDTEDEDLPWPELMSPIPLDSLNVATEAIPTDPSTMAMSTSATRVFANPAMPTSMSAPDNSSRTAFLDPAATAADELAASSSPPTMVMGTDGFGERPLWVTPDVAATQALPSGEVVHREEGDSWPEEPPEYFSADPQQLAWPDGPYPARVEPDVPPTLWFFGAILMMPLALLPLLWGITGTVLIVVILAIFTVVGKAIRWRRRRWWRRGGRRASDTVAMVFVSPIVGIPALAGTTVSIGASCLFGYATWVAVTMGSLGTPEWDVPWQMMISPISPISTVPLLGDPQWALTAGALSWAVLVLTWLMPSSGNLREGVSMMQPPAWVKISVGAICVLAVLVASLFITGTLG